MELTILFYALAVPAVLFAGISKGGLGSGAGFAAAPLLALVLEPADAVALMLPLLMIMDVTALRAWWGKWDAEASRVLILGSLAGVAAGTALFAVINANMLRLLIGSVALGFVAYQLLRHSGALTFRPRRPGPAEGMLWGAFSGFTSFISHAGGPPAAVYLLRRGLSTAEYQATTVIVFTVVNLMKFAAYLWLGLIGQSTMTAVASLAPVAILGTAAGVWAHRKIPRRLYFGAVYVLLSGAGAKLVYDALA